jgi:hypothetical protein
MAVFIKSNGPSYLQREFIDQSRDITLAVIHCAPILLSLEGVALDQNNLLAAVFFEISGF